jgi:hypothetical protein
MDGSKQSIGHGRDDRERIEGIAFRIATYPRTCKGKPLIIL